MRKVIRAAPTLPPPSGLPPERNLAPRDITGLANALRDYHAQFAALFQREEQRHWSLAYLEGQMLELERKSIEPMALALEGGDVQALQQFISQATWDAAALLARHQEVVADTLGDAETGVLILDGCDYPKQGSYSVGVTRQWCGALGKVANCQASVVACYASARGYTLVDRRLYLPKPWFTPAYQTRRDRCGVPPDMPFQTQPQLAWALIATLHRRGVLPFRWVTCDEHFGNNPVLLDRIAHAGLRYLAEVPHDTRVWPTRPPTVLRPGRHGRPPRLRLAPGAPDAQRVDHLAAQMPAEHWTRHTIKEGAKGPLVADFAARRAVAVRAGQPGPDVWVIFRRSVGDTPELKTYLSNAPAATPLATFVRLSGMRWPVESAIKECKGELGLDHYEVRGWQGWHHHTALTFLSHHFLVRIRLRLGEKSSGADRAPGPRPAPSRAAPPSPRPRDGAGPARLRPAAELRRLPLPSPPHATPARFVLTT